MAKTAMKIKQQRKAKFSTREYNRCRIRRQTQNDNERSDCRYAYKNP